MTQYAKRVLAWLLALVLLLSCGISGLVLPAAAADGNLIANGDFELGATGTWKEANTALITVADGVGYGGGKALQFAAGGATDVFWKGLNLSLVPNSKYEITFMAKGPRVRVTANTVKGISTVYQDSAQVGDKWTEYRVTFTTSDEPSIDSNWGLYFRRDDTVTEPTYIDNVSLHQFDSASERIMGGDFEVLSPQQWSTYFLSKKATLGIEVITEQNGNNALKIPAMTADPGDLWVANLGLEPETTYVFKFKAKGAPINVFFYQVKNGGWKITQASDDWTEYTYEFTTQATVDSNFTINLTREQAAALNTAKDTFLDDFSLVKKAATATAIKLNKTTLALEKGESETLQVTAEPDGVAVPAITWASSNAAVATVENGKVTAVGAGTATITATSNELTATCTVTVNEAGISVTPDEELENGEITFDEAAEDVQQGDVVTVTVTPEEGYLMVPGSLRYVNKAGETVRVLNKDFEGEATFGQGDGNTFKMVMPDEKVTLTADFVSIDEQNFAANTIGTACRYTLNEQDEKEYDGIRFLTRLNLANKFDTEGEKFTVTYGGTEYTVLELGSLLKRTENDTALTYDNAVANEQTTGASRMWVSRAYSNASGAFKLVDYTESYIDFTSVMVTSHTDRSYTARGYIRMQAADETIVTLEFDELTNSISDTAEKL
jgi:hypothetical protein